MTLKLTVPCPFDPCEARVLVLQEQPPPPGWPGATEATSLPADFRPSDRAGGPIARLNRHEVEGPASWYGQCPASLCVLPLTEAARTNLRKEALELHQRGGEQEQAQPTPESGDRPGMRHDRCGTVHGVLGPCPLDTPTPGPLHGNDLPPGNVADRVWDKVPCADCGQWIVRTPRGWRHQRGDGTEWFPVNGHTARPRTDAERVSAADRSICTWPGCSRPIIRTAQGWEHRDGEPHDHHHPTPPQGK